MSSTRTQARDHKVLFYAEEGEFVAGVCQYVAHAIADDAVAVVIATAEHIGLIEDHLTVVGFEPETLRAQGRLHVADAAATLDTLLADGALDEGFDRHVASRTREVVGRGQPVRIFGEMVSIAWDRGDVAAALRLEELWNELMTDVPGFQLLCAYRLMDRSKPEALDVCRLHSELVGERSGAPRPGDELHPLFAETLKLARDGSAGRQARTHTNGVLEELGLGELAPLASIVVTELVTNALTHGSSAPVLTVTALPDALRMAVGDRSHDLPRVRDASPDDLSGRGLSVVASLALRWGVRVTDDGKEVWAELGTAPPAAGGAL